MVTTRSIGPLQGSGAPRRIGEACKGGWLGDASIAHQGFAFSEDRFAETDSIIPDSIIADERNSRIFATAQHAAARHACPARLQRLQSTLRKCPSRPVPFLSLGHYRHIR